MDYIIGMCDDNKSQVDLIKMYLLQSEYKDNIKMIEDISPESFLEKVKLQPPQLVFLDIDMGDISGIDLGNQIHMMDEDIVIVYITAYEKYAYEAFQARAFHYLLKPILFESFNKVLTEALEQVQKLKNKTKQTLIVLETKKETVCFEQDEIYFFEKIGRKIRVCAKAREFSYIGNFSSLVEDINSDYFVRCHQGYIVNVEKIRSFKNKTLILVDGFELPVSRTYIGDIRGILSKKLFVESH